MRTGHLAANAPLFMGNQVLLSGIELAVAMFAGVCEVQSLQDLLHHQGSDSLVPLQPTTAHWTSVTIDNAPFAHCMPLVTLEDRSIAGDEEADGALKDLGEAPFQGRLHVWGTSLLCHDVSLLWIFILSLDFCKMAPDL